MILNVAQDLNDATYARCDYLPCSKIARCRTQRVGEQTQIIPPLGWVLPRRSREMINPQVQSECFCSVECCCRNDGITEPVWENLPAAAVEIARANELPPAPEPGQYGSQRLVDARR